MPKPDFAECPYCQLLLVEGQVSPFCRACGKQLPSDVVERLQLMFRNEEAHRAERARELRSDLSTGIVRETGIAIAAVGFVLLVMGAVRWNSMQSQLSRAFGMNDTLGLLLFVAGAVALAWGLYAAFSGAPGSTSVATYPMMSARTIEGRLRELDDLTSKGLITAEQYEQRKAVIIADL